MKKILFFLVLLISASGFSQEINFDKYQYIVVADKFDFVSETDQYQTSSLTKFLLEKKGFKVFLNSDKLPKDLQVNRCIALFAAIKDDSSMFTIKNTIEIKDCYGEILFSSQEGKSKEKDYKKGYQEAIRNAYETMTDFNYSYNPLLVDVKKDKKNELFIADIDSTARTKTQKVVMTPDVEIETIKEKIIVSKTVDVLYAQIKNNGFQLVNTAPEVVFLILKTNVKNVFIIHDKNGILYKLGEKWVAEFYEKNQLVTREYQIKF
ncbi:hypothetical protein BST83_02425 [Polaribacter filamentus]|uniref:Uncharacterized protein n=1 Tax=Polaribacter filamentus TaxID=53483 RepID=A0A2S7L0W5_9FLAO|nr:hypothetical protein BST83_02425 [Polaribacter filamentus]